MTINGGHADERKQPLALLIQLYRCGGVRTMKHSQTLKPFYTHAKTKNTIMQQASLALIRLAVGL